MAEKKATRLSKAAREFNVGISTIVEFLQKKGHDIDSNPNTKLDPDLYVLLEEEYNTDLNVKKESEKLTLQTFRDKQEASSGDEPEEPVVEEQAEELLITDMNSQSEEVKEEPIVVEEEKPEVKEPEKETATKKEVEPAKEEEKSE